MTADLTREIDKAFAEFARRVEEIAQIAAGTEAVLHANARDEEWKRNARFEYELHYEVQYWERVQHLIEQRIASRKAMGDEQVSGREREWESRRDE